MLKNTCKQCGTCCRKGGPALHIHDISLVENGIIKWKDLYTLRKGELAMDNVAGRLIPLNQEIIKLKGRSGGWTCIFFENQTNKCSIYQNRPVECSALKCWDTRDIEELYAIDRLNRSVMISKDSWLWELIKDHEKKCSYAKVKQLMLEKISQKARKKLSEIIAYDFHIRSLITEKAGIDPLNSDFLFGRPLKVTVPLLVSR
ncbi:Zinc/iron-chelating domain-containing protein [Candidatus Magnetomoraceae bacterium gMMP-15]